MKKFQKVSLKIEVIGTCPNPFYPQGDNWHVGVKVEHTISFF